MRIISGKLKGKSINFLKNKVTRPLRDSVKENIFNVLKHSKLVKPQIQNSKVLDLYSGVGSFGIECISRGSENVTFVERDYNVINILKKNLENLSIINKSILYNQNIEDVLTKNIKDKYDILFLDPPFSNFSFIQNLKLINDKKIFQKDHIVIIHRERDTKESFNNILKIIEEKYYGRSKILFGVFN